jgi:hypothetical protein
VSQYFSVLFAGLNNDGRQKLIVVRTTGPLLFLNPGDDKFHLQPDAFRFAQPPQGTFTGVSLGDYDRDGWLDIDPDTALRRASALF